MSEEEQLQEVVSYADGKPIFTYPVKPYSEEIKKEIKKYNINEFYITGQIIGFGDERLNKFKENQTFFEVIDKRKEISMVFKFEGVAIVLESIIKLENTYIADGIKFCNLSDQI